MTGWKAYAGAILAAVGAILDALGYGKYTELLIGIGAALGIIGIRAKQERIDPGK